MINDLTTTPLTGGDAIKEEQRAAGNVDAAEAVVANQDAQSDQPSDIKPVDTMAKTASGRTKKPRAVPSKFFEDLHFNRMLDNDGLRNPNDIQEFINDQILRCLKRTTLQKADEMYRAIHGQAHPALERWLVTMRKKSKTIRDAEMAKDYRVAMREAIAAKQT